MIFYSKIMKRVFTVIMCLAFIATSVFVGHTYFKADELIEDGVTYTVIAYEYDGTDAVAGEDLTEYADSGNDYIYSSTTGNGTMTASTTGTDLKHMEWGSATDYGYAVPVLAASSKNPWSADAYVAYTFSTQNYSGLTASVDVGATKKGPANLTIGYYDEEGVFQSVCTYTIAKNKTMYTVNFDLPEKLENQESVVIYVKLADTINVGGNEMTDDAYNTGGELAINNFTVLSKSVNDSSTDETITEETTTDETITEETTTEELSTEKITSEETTTGAMVTETNASEEKTTAKNQTVTAPTKVSTPQKAVIKKIKKKKISSKKLSIVIKKLSGVNGYQVAVYKTKNSKKAIVKRAVTKRKVTLKSKKLKNKKNLYVRVRAYKLDADGKKVYGKWSKKKKVTIK